MSQSLKRSPPFRAEHMGSLLRPESLFPWNKSRLSAEEQAKAEDEAVKHIVETQLNCGLHGINDGEFRYVCPFFLPYINALTSPAEHPSGAQSSNPGTASIPSSKSTLTIVAPSQPASCVPQPKSNRACSTQQLVGSHTPGTAHSPLKSNTFKASCPRINGVISN